MFAIDVKEWGMENLLREQRERRSLKMGENGNEAARWKPEEL